MDSVKKQLRFFKVLIVVLIVVVLAQFSFLMNAFGGSQGSVNNSFKRVRVLEQPRRVIDPAVATFLQLLSK